MEGHRREGPGSIALDPGPAVRRERDRDRGERQRRAAEGVGEAQPHALSADRDVDGLAQRGVGEDQPSWVNGAGGMLPGSVSCGIDIQVCTQHPGAVAFGARRRRPAEDVPAATAAAPPRPSRVRRFIGSPPRHRNADSRAGRDSWYFTPPVSTTRRCTITVGSTIQNFRVCAPGRRHGVRSGRHVDVVGGVSLPLAVHRGVVGAGRRGDVHRLRCRRRPARPRLEDRRSAGCCCAATGTAVTRTGPVLVSVMAYLSRAPAPPSGVRPLPVLPMPGSSCQSPTFRAAAA